MRTWTTKKELDGVVVHVRTTKKGRAIVDFATVTDRGYYVYDSDRVLGDRTTPLTAVGVIRQAVSLIGDCLAESPHRVRYVASCPTCPRRARIYAAIAGRMGVDYRNEGEYAKTTKKKEQK